MKYLLNFLEKRPDSVGLSDEELQKLLIDVQVGKSTAKSKDDFYESMEKIVNELKSSAESAAFHKPVVKRDAPDYHLFVHKPMDLSTVLKNVKNQKYKSKAEFGADLDLIWENCLIYNSQESHPLRAAARFMQQKTKHHLEFLVDRTDRGSRVFSLGVSRAGSFAPSNVHQSPATAVDDDDAMDEDADGELDTQGMKGSKTRGPMPNGASQRHGTPNGRSPSRDFRDGSQAAAGEGRAASKVASPSRSSNEFSIDTTPAVTRTVSAMTSFFQTCEAGPSNSDKGKAKELLRPYTAPAWYPPVDEEDEEAMLEGQWWTALAEESILAGGVPSVPRQVPDAVVASPTVPKRRGRRRPSDVSHREEEDRPNGHVDHKPRRSRPVKLAKVVMQSVEELAAVRRTQNKLLEFQRLEAEGAPLPRIVDPAQDEDEVEAEDQIRLHRKAVKEERREANERARNGGETGEQEATESLKQASAALLAHAGFEGANEAALNTFTRVAADQFANLGKTFRLFMDRFSKRMTPEEIILHVLFENGAIAPETLEGYIRDDVDRSGAKISDLLKKTRQAYVDVARAPVIEDDMLFAQDGEMLMTGNFTEELGEDFFGLRELGLDKEYGMSSLSIPASLFHGRGKKAAAIAQGDKGPAAPEYPPPPAFVPLTAAQIPAQIGLMRSFYTSRLETGRDLSDDAFDPSHAAIGSLGQIVIKHNAGAAKRKTTSSSKAQPNGSAPKKKKLNAQPGVGKGNWVRPPKEERQRRAEEKRLRLEAQAKMHAKLEVMPSTPTAA